MEKGINEGIFVSPFDGSKQSYLIRRSEHPMCRGIAIFLHGATHHKQQGFDRSVFNGTFGCIQEYFEKNKYTYVCPEYRSDSWMSKVAESDRVHFINNLKTEFKTNNVILVGGSMGGTSCLIFSTRHPEIISGVLAMCPATDMEKLYYEWTEGNQKYLAYGIERAYGGTPLCIKTEYRRRLSIRHIRALKNKPVALIHGDSDILISVEQSRIFVKEAKKKGVKIFYQEIGKGDHDFPIRQFTFVRKALSWLEERILLHTD